MTGSAKLYGSIMPDRVAPEREPTPSERCVIECIDDRFGLDTGGVWQYRPATRRKFLTQR
jgi:hypothetical protein